MKYRSDFVTNSSSSSFIVAFNSKEEGIEYFEKKLKYDKIFQEVIDDINRAKPMTMKEVLKYAEEEFMGETHYILMCKPYGVHRSFCDYMEEKYQDIKYHEIFNHPDCIAYQKELIKNKMEEFKKRIENKSFFVELEYEDHTPNGSELEHNIMPQLDCTMERFSHH